MARARRLYSGRTRARYRCICPSRRNRSASTWVNVGEQASMDCLASSHCAWISRGDRSQPSLMPDEYFGKRPRVNDGHAFTGQGLYRTDVFPVIFLKEQFMVGVVLKKNGAALFQKIDQLEPAVP